MECGAHDLKNASIETYGPLTPAERDLIERVIRIINDSDIWDYYSVHQDIIEEIRSNFGMALLEK